MNLLILGGTAFVGRTIAESALAAGHQVTLFNRGERNPSLFSDLPQLKGDRLGDASALAGKRWDAVLDCSAYVPRAVANTSQYLANACDRYLFISTISVYADFAEPGQDENSPLAVLEDPTTETVDGKTYGGLKVLCEQSIQETFGNRATLVRPGLIVGPYDHTDRFTYWPVSLAQLPDVVAPDLKNQPVQFIDARDLAEWCIRLLEADQGGTFNATGPLEPYSLDFVLDSCRLGGPANIRWTDPARLSELGAEAWTDFPFVLDYSGDRWGMMQIDVSRAIASGLTYRPLHTTVQETLDWALSRPADYALKAGISRERHSELLRNLA